MRGAVLIVALAVGACSGAVTGDSAGSPGSAPGGSGTGSGNGSGPAGMNPTGGQPGVSIPPSPGAPAGSAGFSCALRPVSSPSFQDLPAAPGAKLRVRVESSTTGVRWAWGVVFDADRTVQIPIVPIDELATVVEFPVERPGFYLITATGLGCMATAPAFARDLKTRLAQFRLRATPPPASGLPVQESAIQIVAGTPVTQDLVLMRGDTVSFDPQDAAGMSGVPSYVRVSQVGSDLAFEGYTGLPTPFQAILLPPAAYDVLVVPDRDFAPVLHTARTPAAINVLPRRLDPGTALAGQALDGAGMPVRNVRVVLRAGVLTSTVGESDASGAFAVRVREGQFGAVFSAPPDSGLPDAHVAADPGLAVAQAARIDVRWNAVAAARLELAIRSTDGMLPPEGTRVRVEIDPPLADAAAVVLRPEGGPAVMRTASGRLRVTQAVTATGGAIFPRLPRARYRVTIIPPDARSAAAVTDATVDLSSGDPGARELRIGAKVKLRGDLAGPAEGARITAFPVGTDLSRPPVTGTVGAAGAWELAVDPQRRYVLLAEPAAGTAARVFVGMVEVGATAAEAPRRTLPPALPVRGRVTVDASMPGVPGTVLQVYCAGAAADCPDRAIPLAETVTDALGRYELALPDPGVL